MNELTKSALAWAFAIALGPLHFAGEMVGPAGGISKREWTAALVGTLLWGLVGMLAWEVVFVR